MAPSAVPCKLSVFGAGSLTLVAFSWPSQSPTGLFRDNLLSQHIKHVSHGKLMATDRKVSLFWAIIFKLLPKGNELFGSMREHMELRARMEWYYMWCCSNKNHLKNLKLFSIRLFSNRGNQMEGLTLQIQYTAHRHLADEKFTSTVGCLLERRMI